jgi:hypothetical protein
MPVQKMCFHLLNFEVVLVSGEHKKVFSELRTFVMLPT